ncbi:MAG: ABC transporter permease [Firmicutes bacterium]|nr:ABC transporter permease [Bacillota bacterium]
MQISRPARRSGGFRKLWRPKEKIPQALAVVLGSSAFALVLLAWSVLTYGGFVPPLFLPSPTEVIVSGYRAFTQFGLWNDIAASVYRVSAGWFLAALLGVPLGILMGSLRVVAAFIEPLIGFIRYMPASAFIPLLILWVGIDDSEKIAVIFIGTFFQLVIMIADVAKNVPKDLLESSYTLGARPGQVLWRILLPASLPGIVDTLRITLGWAWTYLVVAELVAAASGLGHMIMDAQRYLRTANIIVGIVIIGLLGMVLDLFFKMLHRGLFPWMSREGKG